jgi:hypothetical protein
MKSRLNIAPVTTNDQPLFIGRNTATSGDVKQIDLRYSRFIPIREAMRIEVVGEAPTSSTSSTCLA